MMVRYRCNRYRKTKKRKPSWAGIALLLIVVGVIMLRLNAGDESSSDSQAGEHIRDVSNVAAESEGSPIQNHSTQEVVDEYSDFDKMLKRVEALKQAGDIIEVRDLLNAALRKTSDIRKQAEIKQRLAALSEKWLFGSQIFSKDRLCSGLKVQPGDSLSVIGRKNKVTAELLQRINRIASPKLLRAGATIKVVHGPFNAKLNRTTYMLDLYLQDVYVKSYSVGLGKEGMQTPTGLWRVEAEGKVPKADWRNPETGETLQYGDPKYPLGPRWIGLEGMEGEAIGRTSYGIHGTNEVESIGRAASRGCIRLNNEDVLEVYDLLVGVHSLIRVVE